jgi:uncharacterized protein with HEPN domain
VKDDRLYLTHIKEAIDKINLYTNAGYGQFADDPKTQDAVIRNFEIIGEAGKQISEQTKQLRSDIPWRDIAGLRDVLIHDYMGVDIKEVWNIVANHIPVLEKAIDELLGLV